MSEQAKRLREILSHENLNPIEVRDGLTIAYWLVTRLNQTKGNAAVGLKQEGDGLTKHITGFMEAIFWERGFSFDDPAVDQLAETKMMMDGMTQIYAMPETFQNVLAELYDTLMAKAMGRSARISPDVAGLLDDEAQDSPAAAAEPESPEPSGPEMPGYMHPMDEQSFTLPMDSAPAMPVYEAEPAVDEPEKFFKTAAPETDVHPQPVAFFSRQDDLLPEVESGEPPRWGGEQATDAPYAESESLPVLEEGEPPQSMESPVVAPAASLESEPLPVLDASEPPAAETAPWVEPEQPGQDLPPILDNWELPPEPKPAPETIWNFEVLAQPPAMPEMDPESFPEPVEDYLAAAPLAQSTPVEPTPASPKEKPVAKKRTRKKASAAPETPPRQARGPVSAEGGGLAPAEDVGPAPAEPKPSRRRPRKQKQVKITLASMNISDEEQPSAEPAPEAAAAPAEVPEITEAVAPMEPQPDNPVYENLAPESVSTVKAEPVAWEPEVPQEPAPAMAVEPLDEPFSIPEVPEPASPETENVPTEEIEKIAGEIDLSIQSSPSSWNELERVKPEGEAVAMPEPVFQAEPVLSPVRESVVLSADAPELLPAEAEEVRRTKAENEAFLREEAPAIKRVVLPDELDAPVEVSPKNPRRPWMAALFFLLGVLLAGGGTYYWYGFRVGSAMSGRIAELNQKVKTVEAQLVQSQQATGKLQEQLDLQQKASEKPPADLNYLKAGQGLMLYWPTGSVARKFNIYQGKDQGQEMAKINEVPILDNYYTLKNVARGTWSFAVSAMDLKGRETAKSELVTMKFPLKK